MIGALRVKSSEKDDLGLDHTEQVKTELTNQLARNVKTEISHLF